MVPALAFAAAMLTSSPAAAMNTQQERDWGAQISREVIAEQGVLPDPLLSTWVDRVGRSLVAHAIRSDIRYTFTVVDSEEVNAFSVPGGYVFVDAGLLNFVHSDDELAAVLGHEIGHVERRHIVTLDEKAKALQIIFDVAGLFAPGVSRFGDLAGDLILFKLSRVDELQADQYGLMLMSDAGYDPQGMVEFLRRLQRIDPEHKSLFGRYFETHPALGDRVNHLRGYPALDRPTPDALLARALHDADEGEFFAARQRVDRVLAQRPNDSIALDERAKLAALFGAIPNAAAGKGLSELTARAQDDVAAALADGDAVKARLKLADRDLDDYLQYLESMYYYVDPQARLGIARGGRLDRILTGQAQIGQYLDHSYDQVGQSIAEAQDVADADVKLQKDLLARVQRPDPGAPLDSPQMVVLLSRAEAAHAEALRAADAARGAMAVGWTSGKTVLAFLHAFDDVSNYKGGDVHDADFRKLRVPLYEGLVAAKNAAAAGDTAARLLNDAQSLETQDRIDLAAPEATPKRSRAFAAVLAQRTGLDDGDLARAHAVLADAADEAAAAIIAAERGRSAEAVADDMRRKHMRATDYADSVGIRGETLQLELGLVWLAYSDGNG